MDTSPPTCLEESLISSNVSRPSNLLHSSPLETCVSYATTPEGRGFHHLPFHNTTDTSPIESIVGEKENVFYSPNPSDLSYTSNISCDASDIEPGSKSFLTTAICPEKYTHFKSISTGTFQNTIELSHHRHKMLSPEIGRRDYGTQHHNFTGVHGEALASPTHDKNPNNWMVNAETNYHPQPLTENSSFRKRKREPSVDNNQNQVTTVVVGHTGISMDIAALNVKAFSSVIHTSDIIHCAKSMTNVSHDREPPMMFDEKNERHVVSLSSLHMIAEEQIISSNKRILGTPDYLAPG